METPVEPVALQANDGALQLILAAAYRLSIAANELKSIEGMSLEPNELSDAWDHAYAELYRANDEYKHALEHSKPHPPAATGDGA